MSTNRSNAASLAASLAISVLCFWTAFIGALVFFFVAPNWLLVAGIPLCLYMCITRWRYASYYFSQIKD
jgi:hypothetical protein